MQSDEHLLTVLRYIEANPLRAKIVPRADDYRWSGYRVYGLEEAGKSTVATTNSRIIVSRGGAEVAEYEQDIDQFVTAVLRVKWSML